jgi:hypothetical protein
MTFEQEFNSRVNAFLSQSGLSPTALGLRAVGDPNPIHQIRTGVRPVPRAVVRDADAENEREGKATCRKRYRKGRESG